MLNRCRSTRRFFANSVPVSYRRHSSCMWTAREIEALEPCLGEMDSFHVTRKRTSTGNAEAAKWGLVGTVLACRPTPSHGPAPSLNLKHRAVAIMSPCLRTWQHNDFNFRVKFACHCAIRALRRHHDNSIIVDILQWN